LIVPTRGIVKFHERCLLEEADREEQEKPESEKGTGGSGPLLETYIRNVRENLGIDTDNNTENNNEEDEEEESRQQHLSGVWSNHLEELGDKLNQESDRTGFLRMVNRSSRLNASSYSLSSLFSVGSLGGVSNGGALTSSSSRAGSTRSRRGGGRAWQGPSSLQQLYQLLIEPMEDDLPEGGAAAELLLVLEGDLYLIPFPVLKGPNCMEYLCEKFSLMIVPSLTHLKTRRLPHPQTLLATLGKKPSSLDDPQPPPQRLVVGNPRIPSSITDHWGWNELPQAEQEAAIVAEILQTRAVTGSMATKDLLLSQLGQAESVHLACHVSWKLSALVVSPAEFPSMESRSPGGNSGNPRRYSIHSDTIHEELEDDHRSEATTMELPALSEFLLTAADLLKLQLTAKLVVISSCYTRSNNNRYSAGAATSDGLVSLSRALLAAGAQCVMICLWPVPEMAVRLIMKAFYSSLLQGSRVSRALAEAMTAVQTTKYFQHPANWAGFLLIGQDVRLTNKVALMGQALREIISAPDRCRDALRVTLHLVRYYKTKKIVQLFIDEIILLS
jgi:CHAT domain-containing protein